MAEWVLLPLLCRREVGELRSYAGAEVAAYVPADRLLIETDSPYLSPVPFRGKRNSPLRVGLVAQCLADVRQVSLEEMAQCTWDNAQRFFCEDAQG